MNVGTDSSDGEGSASTSDPYIGEIVEHKVTRNAYETITDEKADRLTQLKRRDVKGGKVTFPMRNYGNTCFFNSILQCLVHSRPYLNYTLNNTTHSEKLCDRNPNC